MDRVDYHQSRYFVCSENPRRLRTYFFNNYVILIQESDGTLRTVQYFIHVWKIISFCDLKASFLTFYNLVNTTLFTVTK